MKVVTLPSCTSFSWSTCIIPVVNGRRLQQINLQIIVFYFPLGVVWIFYGWSSQCCSRGELWRDALNPWAIALHQAWGSNNCFCRNYTQNSGELWAAAQYCGLLLFHGAIPPTTPALMRSMSLGSEATLCLVIGWIGTKLSQLNSLGVWFHTNQGRKPHSKWESFSLLLLS